MPFVKKEQKKIEKWQHNIYEKIGISAWDKIV
jgi:hypothetical protein